MIGSVEFIRCAGCLATSEHPIITSDADMDDYVVSSISGGVKFVEDLVQTLVLPTFNGCSECNMVRLTQQDQPKGETPWKAYYWITDMNRSSIVNGATVFNLEFNAITTMLKKGSKVKGQWLRSPVNYTPWKQQNVVSGTMGLKRKIQLMPYMYDAYKQQLLWVSLTASKTPENISGSYEIYGFPIEAGTLMDLYQDSSYTVQNVETEAYDAETETTLEDAVFPRLNSLFHGQSLPMLGIAADAILDISITPYPPFDYTVNVYGDTQPNKFYLVRANGIKLYPRHIKYNDGTKDTYSGYVMYNITASRDYQYNCISTVTNIELNEMEATAGQLSIMQGNGSVMGMIPTGWATATDTGYTIKLRSQIIADYSQLVYRIAVLKQTVETGDTEELGVFTLPGTHIPYMGNAWDSYRAYSMSYDREAMEFTIEQTKTAMIANVADAGINLAVGVATGGASIAAKQASMASTGATQAQITYANTAYQGQQVQAGASAGTGIIGSIVGGYQQMQAAEFNQSLTERRTQAQPGNAYNASDGLFNIYMEMTDPTCVAISLPVNLTETIFNEFVENFGYANEGEYTQELTYGFYQGTIYSSQTMTGPRFSELVNSFNAGIRLIPPTGNQ